MKIANTIAVALGAIALFAAAESTAAARATDIDDYRWDHVGSVCFVVETHTPNRWGDDVTVRRRVCL